MPARRHASLFGRRNSTHSLPTYIGAALIALPVIIHAAVASLPPPPPMVAAAVDNGQYRNVRLLPTATWNLYCCVLLHGQELAGAFAWHSAGSIAELTLYVM